MNIFVAFSSINNLHDIWFPYGVILSFAVVFLYAMKICPTYQILAFSLPPEQTLTPFPTPGLAGLLVPEPGIINPASTS